MGRGRGRPSKKEKKEGGRSQLRRGADTHRCQAQHHRVRRGRRGRRHQRGRGAVIKAGAVQAGDGEAGGADGAVENHLWMEEEERREKKKRMGRARPGDGGRAGALAPTLSTLPRARARGPAARLTQPPRSPGGNTRAPLPLSVYARHGFSLARAPVFTRPAGTKKTTAPAAVDALPARRTTRARAPRHGHPHARRGPLEHSSPAGRDVRVHVRCAGGQGARRERGAQARPPALLASLDAPSPPPPLPPLYPLLPHQAPSPRPPRPGTGRAAGPPPPGRPP